MKNLRILLAGLALCAVLTSGKTPDVNMDDRGDMLRGDVWAEMNDSIDRLVDVAAANQLNLHSVMVVKDGKIVGERWMGAGWRQQPHILNSVSKTFTALAVGKVIESGKLKLTDKVISFFPDKLPGNVSDYLADMDIRDLLTMTCGHAKDKTVANMQREQTDRNMDWVRIFLGYPVDCRPGEVYCYNSLGTITLAAIVQKLTGKKMIDLLQETLFEPLQIKGATWSETDDGINHAGWGLYLKTEDLAKVGQMLLQGGRWNGRQLFSADWIREMQKRQAPSVPAGMNSSQLKERPIDPAKSDWVQGYGYQMWRCRHNAVRADGSHGQYIVIMPDQNAVVVMTADNTRSLQAQLNLVWDYLLPVLDK